jgi:hypothetical protein
VKLCRGIEQRPPDRPQSWLQCERVPVSVEGRQQRPRENREAHPVGNRTPEMKGQGPIRPEILHDSFQGPLTSPRDRQADRSAGACLTLRDLRGHGQASDTRRRHADCWTRSGEPSFGIVLVCRAYRVVAGLAEWGPSRASHGAGRIVATRHTTTIDFAKAHRTCKAGRSATNDCLKRGGGAVHCLNDCGRYRSIAAGSTRAGSSRTHLGMMTGARAAELCGASADARLST